MILVCCCYVSLASSLHHPAQSIRPFLTSPNGMEPASGKFALDSIERRVSLTFITKFNYLIAFFAFEELK